MNVHLSQIDEQLLTTLANVTQNVTLDGEQDFLYRPSYLVRNPASISRAEIEKILERGETVSLKDQHIKHKSEIPLNFDRSLVVHPSLPNGQIEVSQRSIDTLIETGMLARRNVNEPTTKEGYFYVTHKGCIYTQTLKEKKNLLDDELLSNETTIDTTLIMKGGGAKGLAYLGAIQVLVDFYNFTWYVGTSAGAIAAALLAAGYSAVELDPIFKEKRLTDFFDAKFYQWPGNLLFRKGLFSAQTLNNWLEGLISKKLDLYQGTPIRLEQLQPRHCTIYAVRKGVDFLDFDSHSPETKTKSVAHAVRASMAIPYVFQPQTDSEERVFDGGLRHNYPLLAFLNKYNKDGKMNFLGLYLGPKVHRHKLPSRFVLRDILEYFLSGNDEQALREYPNKTIIIDPSPISTLRFNLTRDEKEFLLATGRAAALNFVVKQSDIPETKKPSLESVQRANEQANVLHAKVIRAFNKRRWVRLALAISLTGLIIWGVYFGYQKYKEWNQPTVVMSTGISEDETFEIAVRKFSQPPYSVEFDNCSPSILQAPLRAGMVKGTDEKSLFENMLLQRKDTSQKVNITVTKDKKEHRLYVNCQ